MTSPGIGEMNSTDKNLKAFTRAVDLAQEHDGNGESLLEWVRLFSAVGDWALLEAPVTLPRPYIGIIYRGMEQLLAAMAAIAAIEYEVADESGLNLALKVPGRWRGALPKISLRWLFGWQADRQSFDSFAAWSYDQFITSFSIIGVTAKLAWMLLRPWPLALGAGEVEDFDGETAAEQEGTGDEDVRDEEEEDAVVVAGLDEDGEETLGGAEEEDEVESLPTADVGDCKSLLDELAVFAGIDPHAQCTQEQMAGLEARLEFSPVDVDARWELAQCLAQARAFSQAIEHFQEVEHRRPENDEVIKQLCYCFAAREQWEDAFSEAHKLTTHHMSEVEGQDLLDLLAELQAACSD